MGPLFQPPISTPLTFTQRSREGAAQVRLKLGLVNNDEGNGFTFTVMPQEVVHTECEKFKMELTGIMGQQPQHHRLAPAQVSKGPITTAASMLTPSKPATLAAASRAPASPQS